MSDPKPSTRLNRLLIWAFAILLVSVASHLVIGLISIPEYYRRVTTQTVPTIDDGVMQMSNAFIAEQAALRGMSLETYALYSIVIALVFTVVFCGVSVLILLNARGEWFRWFTALILAFVPTDPLWDFTIVAQNSWKYLATGAVLWPLFLVYLYLFPNGKAVPRWTRWLLGGLALLHFVIMATMATMELTGSIVVSPQSLEKLFGVVLLAFPLILACQVYRYLRESTPVERLQTRWVVVGLGFYVLASFFFSYLSSGNFSNSVGYLGDLDRLLMLVIPVTIGISVLRYRLFEIDVIIRRTLIYGGLTIILGAVYFGLVTVLQALFSKISNQQSTLSIVLSTLVIAALFNPFRRRIQGFIDHRFYRRRYNTEQTLLSFAATLRNEVDLDQLSSHLISVVEETMQPENVSLWLKDQGKRRSQAS